MVPIRLGRLFGIPLEIRGSFLILLAAVMLFLGGLSGILVVLLAFASVILHELGHALVARRLGVGVSSIELHFFGGVARLESQPKSPKDELAIAAAGPAVSFLLGGLSLVLAIASGLWIFELLATINLILGAFNLIPALPMDGGRILRALLEPRLGFARSTQISVKISRVVSVLFAIVGLAFVQLQLLLLAGVLWYMASAELRMSRAQAPNPWPVRHHGYKRGPGQPPGWGPQQGDPALARRRIINVRVD
jgi:Zn-dependent protease